MLMLAVSDVDDDNDLDVEAVLDSDCDALMLFEAVPVDDGDDDALTLVDTEHDSEVESLSDTDGDDMWEPEGVMLVLGVKEGVVDSDIDEV